MKEVCIIIFMCLLAVVPGVFSDSDSCFSDVFYFTDYDVETGWNHPESMVDCDDMTYAKTLPDCTVQTVNTPDVEFVGDVVSVEIRCHVMVVPSGVGTGGGNPNPSVEIYLKPVLYDKDGFLYWTDVTVAGVEFWTVWYDITNDVCSPDVWTVEHINNLVVDVFADDVIDADFKN